MNFVLFVLAIVQKRPMFIDDLHPEFSYEPLFRTRQNVEFKNNNEIKAPLFGLCNIYLSNCRLSNNYIYETSDIEGSGGALYIDCCLIDIFDCVFDANVARIGGSIYLSSSIMYIGKKSKDTVFSNNFAFIKGGAMALFIPTSSVIIQNTQFINNMAATTGGAIHALIEIVDISLESCNFTNNTAAHNGGALCLLGGDVAFTAFVSDCLFMENSAGQATTFQRTATNIEIKNNEKTRSEYHGRGCPGIFLQEGNLNTQGCTFLHNHQYFPRYNVLGDGVHSTFYMNAQGASIMLADAHSWISDSDCITNYFTYNHNGVPPVLHFSKQNKTCGDVIAIQSIDVPVAPVNKGDESPTNIPEPTKYTYQATAITHEPAPTFTYFEVFRQLSPFKPETKSYMTLTPEPTESIVQFPPNASTTIITTNSSTITQTSTLVNTKVLTIESKQDTTTYVEIDAMIVVYQTTYTNVTTEKVTLLQQFDIKPGDDGKKGPNILLIAILVSVGVLLIIIAVALIVYFKWKKEHKTTSSEETIDAGEAAGTTKTQVIHTNPDEVSLDLSENETLQDAPSHDTDMEYMNNDDF